MVMFKTLDLRLQMARGRKQVLHDRATSRAGSHHKSHMVVGIQVHEGINPNPGTFRKLQNGLTRV